ncbi:THUMP-like domain-containing protein [Bizionia paragorgiae]|uniref:class I SAM-dependent methyltransferase n=1 Tax=Bizionia paragorgiae TaxID=283786 RepID=UPI00299E7850|nr:class I SAM-dependent methyltransferase [Bizionia paragorgiae]MDX1271976.1 class I SAM-dependent methyltransferase [Bizionia paragorgiae]
MDSTLLNREQQEFIDEHLDSNLTALLLKESKHSTFDIKALIEQIEAKKRAQKKLPTWFAAKNIYYPNKLNIEQTSSEATALYKSNLVSGDSLIDLTGGFGIDCYYFSKRFKQVTHCEINPRLSQIVKHNFSVLNRENIRCLPQDGLAVLEENDSSYSTIYVDPSRRNDSKGKVFMLSDCLPNIPKHLDLLFKRSKTILIKTSPLLDISIGISELQHVKTIYSVALNNEVKELLWLLEKGYNDGIEVRTVNINKGKQDTFNFELEEETSHEADYSVPLNYLYEPNAAILKSGAFNSLATRLKLKKLHKHSHLYTSQALIDFPGRSFKIDTTSDYNVKHFKKTFKLTKANVTTRNFPDTVSSIRKKLKLSDGGDIYLFFTTNLNNKKVVIRCTKTSS